MRKKSFVTLSGFILFAKYSRNLSLFYLLCKMLLVGWYRLLECKKNPSENVLMFFTALLETFGRISLYVTDDVFAKLNVT